MSSSLLSRVIGLGGLSLQITPCPSHNGLHFFAMLHPTKIKEGYKEPTFYPTAGMTEYATPEWLSHLHRRFQPEDHSRPWYPIGVFKTTSDALETLEAHVLHSIMELSMSRYHSAVLALGTAFFSAAPELQQKWYSPSLTRVVDHKGKYSELFNGEPTERYSGW